MRKVALMIVISLLSFCTYGQLALEGFESPWTGTPAAPPGGWAVYNQVGNVTWARSPAGNTSIPPFAGTYAAYLNRENVAPSAPIPTNWLITPQFNSPANGLLHFYSRLIYPGDYGTIFKIKIAVVTDPSLPVQDLPWADLVPPMSEFALNPIQQQYVEKMINIPAAYVGQQIRIAFIMQGDEQERWLIDNVEVISQCDPPFLLTATNVTLTSADLSWTNPTASTSWEIEVVEDVTTPTGTGQVYTGALPYHKTGLTAGTSYKYYVRTVCTDGGKSTWVGPFYFITSKIGEKCSDPLVLPTALPVSVSDNTANYADNYDGAPGTGCGTTGTYLNGNDVVYSYTPAVNGAININLSSISSGIGVFVYSDCNNIGVNCLAGAVPISSIPVAVISSLSVTANTTYYIVVSSSSATMAYNLTLQQINCAAPTGLAVSTITPLSANLSWAAGTASAWQIAVQPAGTGIPLAAGQNVTQNTNLTVSSTSAGVAFTQSSNYEYYVRANCGDGTYSIWAGPFAFATTQVPVTLNYSENFDGNIAHNWFLNNGAQPNKWVVGAATSNSSTNSLYISENSGNSNTYNIAATSVVHAYRDIQIPAGLSQMSVSFDLKAGGESNDNVRAWLVPSTFVPTPGQPVTISNSAGVQVGGDMYLTAGWATQNLIFNVSTYAGTTRRLILEWRNNATLGTQPGAAIDNINIKAVTCPAPTALTLGTATQSSANFSWTAPTGVVPAGYEYYYSQSNTPPAATTQAMGSVSGATTATLSPLSPSTQYYVWVRSSCGLSDKSLWIGPVSVTVPQVPATIDYSQNFDAGAHGFVLSNGTQMNKWMVGSATSNSPSQSLYVTDGSTNGDNTYFPDATSLSHAYRDIAIPATASEIRLTFDYKVGGDVNDYFKVWMVPATFVPTPGTQITQAADRIQLGANFYNSLQWTNASFDISVIAYQGQLRRLIFEWRNNNTIATLPPAAIDNINIKVISCPKPISLAVKNVTNTMATLDWAEAGSATSWELAYMPAAGVAEPIAPGIQITGNSEYTPPVGTFVYGTQYAFYVRSNCSGATGAGKWAGPFYFALKPLYDDCAQAMVVPVNPDTSCVNSVNGSVLGATDSAQALGCSGGTKDDDVWFEFVATSTTHTITFSNISGDAQGLFHALYAGSDCSALTWKYCNFANPNVSVAQNLVIGQTYKIRVWTFTPTPNQTTSFKLCITTPPAPPVNDACSSAIALTVNPTLDCATMTPGTTYSATESPEGTTCSGGKDDDVWYTFVATNTSHRILFLNVAGSTTTLNHVLYSGNTCGSLTQIYCSYTNNSWANGLIVGQTYYIRVYTNTALLGQTTTFNVCVSTPPLPPVNDNCGNATIVPVNTGLVCNQVAHGTIESATASPEPNTCTNVSDDDDVWFQFTATSTKHFIELKNVVGNMPDLYHVLYSGSQCGTLTQLYCSDANYSIAQNLTVGQVYKIRVYSVVTNPNLNFAFDVCITSPIASPVNDECITAITIPVNNDPTCTLYTSGNVYGATASPEINTCGSAGSADDDIWYEFTATHETHLISLSNITGSATSLYVSLYSGECGALTKINSCTTAVESLASNLIVGAKYKIRVFTSSTTANQTTSFNICIRVPNAPIIVDAVSYTPEQLVKNVLFNSPCASISNVTSISGPDFGDVPSMGYFDAPSGAFNGFPFNYGVVLTTSDVNLAKGPYNSLNGNSGTNSYTWLGDTDLDAIIEANDPLQAGKTINATALEFDFVPLINKFEFDFLFASSEYAVAQCGYSDAFAFILTDEAGNSENLAVIPNTNIPVSVTTIRDGLYNANCGSANVEYFGQNNVTQPLLSAINFTGQTKKLTASAIVVPGQTYHIKLVIADYNDPKNGSAVFLGGGTFNIGTLDLGADLLVSAQTAICDTGSAVIDTHLPSNDYNFEWYKDGVTIAGATAPAYEVTEPGTYGVLATLQGVDCSFEGSKIVEQYPLVTDITGDPADMIYCDASGFHTFDLTPNVDAIAALPADSQNFTTTVYLTEADAQANTNPIAPATYTAFTNTVQDLQTLWTRTVYSVTGCIGIKSFDLVVQDLTPQYTISGDFSICEGTSGIIDVVITDADTTPVTYTWTKDGAALTDITPSITVTATGAYTVVINRSGCTATSTVNVVVTPTPVADAPANVTVCSSYVLPVLSVNNTYYNAATNAAIAAGTEITETTTFNIVASSGTTPECTSQNTFTVTVNNAFVLAEMADVTVCNNYVLPALTLGNYYTGTGATGTMLHEGDTISATQAIYVYAETGTVPNCTAEESFTVNIIPVPVADAPADVTVCSSYILPALSANNIYHNASTNTVVAAGTEITETTAFNIIATSGTIPECTSQSTFTVTVNNTFVLPEIADVTTCGSYVLPALTLGNYYPATGATGTMLHEGDEITITQTIYVYAETGLVPNCTAEESFVITINPSPVADAPANVDACESYTLPALTTGNYYTGQNGTGTQLAADQTITATQLIYVYAQLGNCTDENSFMVNIHPAPAFNLGDPYSACSAANITIDVAGANFNSIDVTYAWTLDGTPISGGSSITASGFGTYALTVTVNNCTHTESVEVIQDTDAIDLFITDECKDAVYMVSVSDINGSFDTNSATYLWAGPNGFTTNKREFAATLAGQYTIKVTTADGCVGGDTFIVTDTACEIQRGISPNGDGMNDEFDLSKLDVKHLGIFNRYGQEVYNKDNYKKEWTGQTNNGKELPTGTYFYMVEFVSGEAKTGWIYINRQN